jgi:predicted short-subunit dehydrogenase-like oxidoreductase (DUF2520 family)
VGVALGLAISRAGWPVTAIASRDAGRRERFAGLVTGAGAYADPSAIVGEADLVILAVPDDAIAAVADSLRVGGGRSIAHTSGVLGAEVLAPALAEGGHAGAFHPLVSFTSDPAVSVQGLGGATIAIEGDDFIVKLLADLARAIGGVPVRLPSGARPAYHAAAAMASGGLVALLDAIATLGAAAGMDEQTALGVYGRLVEQTLANARDVGIGAALTGPVARGDAGTVAVHLQAIEKLAPDVLDLYVAAARRELNLVEERGTLSPNGLERVRAVLAKVV